MLEKLSAAAHRALAEAAKQAADMSAEDISPAHLLLGLVADGSSAAGAELAQAGINASVVRDAIRATTTLPTTESARHRPMSQNLLSLIGEALRISAADGHERATTADLLLVAITDDDGNTRQLLTRAGLSDTEYSRILRNVADHDGPRAMSERAEEMEEISIEIPSVPTGLGDESSNIIGMESLMRISSTIVAPRRGRP